MCVVSKWGASCCRATWSTSKARGVLVTIENQGRTGTRHKAYGVSCCLMDRAIVETITRRIAVNYPNGPPRALEDIGNDCGNKRLARRRLGLLESDFKVVHWAGIKHQVAGALSRLPTTAMDKSLLQDDVPVLMITKAQSEGESIETDAKIWHILTVTMEWTQENLPCRDFKNSRRNQQLKTTYDKWASDWTGEWSLLFGSCQ